MTTEQQVKRISDHVVSSPDVLRFLRVLGDQTRLSIVRMLALSDLRAGELGSALRLPSNALAYHLKQLQSLQLLHDHRSSGDARDVYYHLDLDRLHRLFATTGDTLYPGMTSCSSDKAQTSDAGSTPARRLRVLFLCTHNSARSQLAEGLLRAMGGDLVEAASAGSDPTDVDPDALAVLRELGIDPAPLSAKPLALYSGQPFDCIISVCDRVRDVCPVFPGDPHQVHWSFSDPAVIEDPTLRRAAFRAVAHELQTRIRYLLLPHPATGQRFRSLS